ncbi:insulinase family protein [Pseudomonas sp. JDS28PS106]|uniref:M16 family metallopeptidase n=1 Tax=Pseudomonas sp. JDS28PS106 TaxID=2497235 RepID=UPI002FD30BF7
MKYLIMSLTGLLTLTACAQFGGHPQQQTWDPRITRGQLGNGLEYRLVREASQPGRIDLRLTVKAGSVDETDDQVGVAHMVEHLNFYSRAGQQDNIRTLMNRWGWVQGRHYNAMTSYDRTQYLLSPTTGAAQLDRSLQALSTLTLAGDYDAANLERERPIVIEEWRGGLGVAQRMNDQRTASQRMGSRYPAHRTIGNEGAIRSARLGNLQAFQKRWYVPNNMVLTVVGDIDPATLPARINHWFGQARAGELPDRSYRELPLDDKLKIVRLQDSQSGSNQVALLFRLHEPASRASTLDGLRERLIDRLTLTVLLNQLRDQSLEEGVRSLTVQKSLIGEHSSVLGIAAGVQGAAHEAALRQLLSEIERARRFGLSAAVLQSEKDKIRAIAERMLSKEQPRGFEQWVRDLNDSVTQDKVLLSKQDIARQHLEVLDSIEVRDLDRRLKRWTDSRDRVLQLSAPGTSPLVLPEVAAVEALQQQIADAELAPPQLKPADITAQPEALPTVPAPFPAGKITSRRAFEAEQVEYWQLSNGDRLVWLKRKSTDGRLMMQVDSSAGFHSPALPAWRSQMAAQLAGQSAPHGWSDSQMRRWRTERGVSFGLDQTAGRLQIDLSTLEAKQQLPVEERLRSLLETYRMNQTSTVIEPQAAEAARDALVERQARRGDSVREQQDTALRVLRFGREDWEEPTAEQLQALQAEDLNEDWQRLSRSPATYYLMADVDAATLAPLVEQQLANIPRGAAWQAVTPKPLPGRREDTLAIAVEPRATLQAHAFHPHAWTPEDAARVAALKDIANAALKRQLRGEAGGIYSLVFDTTLDPHSERIESRLSFTSDPARIDELWHLAQTTLAGLPGAIDARDVAVARANLKQQERLRQADDQTQLRRLILSDRRWGDPRYLSRQQNLTEALTQPALQRLAGELFDAANRVTLRLLPATAGKVAP